MKKRISITTIYIALVATVFFSCQKKETNTTVSKEVQESVYKKITDNWFVTTYRIESASQKQLQNWNDFKLLQIELSNKPQPTLGAIRQKTALLIQVCTKSLLSVPTSTNNNELESRLLVVLSKLKMLDNLVNQDLLYLEKIKKYNEEVVVDFELLQKQIERNYARQQIQLEEGELELRDSIVTQKKIGNE